MTHEQLLRIYWAANPTGILKLKGEFGKYVLLGYRYNKYLQASEPIIEGSRYAMDWAINGGPEKMYKPCLKPLSSITDEECIEIAKIIDSLEDNWAIESRDEHVVVVVSSHTKVWVWFDTEINAEELNHTGSHEEWQTYSISHCYSELTDYLRSKSYNLDFEPGQFIEI